MAEDLALAVRCFAAAAPSIDTFLGQSSSNIAQMQRQGTYKGLQPSPSRRLERSLNRLAHLRSCLPDGPANSVRIRIASTCVVPEIPIRRLACRRTAVGQANLRLRVLLALLHAPPLTSSAPNRSALLLERSHYHVSAPAIP